MERPSLSREWPARSGGGAVAQRAVSAGALWGSSLGGGRLGSSFGSSLGRGGSGSGLPAVRSPAPVSSAPALGLPRKSRGMLQVPGSRGWPKGLQPLFFDEIQPRLEECREKISAVDRDLGGLMGLEVSSTGSSLPAHGSSAEPESEVSPAARLRSASAEHGGDLDEEVADTLAKLETELLALHGKWRAVDEDRYQAEKKSSDLARRLSSSEARAEALAAKVAALGGRMAEADREQQALRTKLGVSEAEVQALRSRVETGRCREQVLGVQNDTLHARLYVSQSEQESLRQDLDQQEWSSALLEERLCETEAERERQAQQRAFVAKQAADKVRDELEAKLATERVAAEQRERELKLALATMSLRQKAAEEQLKRLNGAGIPEPPRWFRSAVPTLLTRRKRITHDLMPPPGFLDEGEAEAVEGKAGNPEGSGSPEGRAAVAAPDVGSSAAIGREAGTLPAVEGQAAAAAVEGDRAAAFAEAGKEGKEDQGTDGYDLALDEDAAEALLAIFGDTGVYAGVPELLFAAGLGPLPEDQSVAGRLSGAKYMPASCKVDVFKNSLCLQALGPVGPLQKIPLARVGGISRPEGMPGSVDLDLAAADGPSAGAGTLNQSELTPRRLRLAAHDEDAASALVAAISMPERIKPSSILTSTRTSLVPTNAANSERGFSR